MRGRPSAPWPTRSSAATSPAPSCSWVGAPRRSCRWPRARARAPARAGGALGRHPLRPRVPDEAGRDRHRGRAARGSRPARPRLARRALPAGLRRLGEGGGDGRGPAPAPRGDWSRTTPLADYEDGPAAAWGAHPGAPARDPLRRGLRLQRRRLPGAGASSCARSTGARSTRTRATRSSRRSAWPTRPSVRTRPRALAPRPPSARALGSCAGWCTIRARAPLGGVAGHAGLFSTAADLARWCRMLLGGGELEGRARPLARGRARDDATRAGWRTGAAGGRSASTSTRATPPPRAARASRAAPPSGTRGFTGTSVWLDPESGGFRDPAREPPAPRRSGQRDGAAARGRRCGRRAPAAGTGRQRRAGRRRRTGARGLRALARPAGRAPDARRRAHALRDAHDRPPGRGRGACGSSACSPPEHGLASLGEGAIADGRDARTGLEVVSLYGERARPRARPARGARRARRRPDARRRALLHLRHDPGLRAGGVRGGGG